MQNRYVITVVRTDCLKFAVTAESPVDAEKKYFLQGGYEIESVSMSEQVVNVTEQNDKDGADG